MLLCTVRGCASPLAREDRRLVCARGHSFDVARSGYINLLQPQDRRSKEPGDSAHAVAGRRRVYDLGVATPLLEGIADVCALGSEDVLLDVGCGDGYYSGELAARSGGRARGVDISIPAVDAAARRYPGCEWVVANADRFLPYADRSCSVVTSITARMNAPEFRRVVADEGRVLVALPAPDDLIELRGHGREDRVDRTLGEFGSLFRCVEQRRVTTRAVLGQETVEGLLASVYRPLGAAVGYAGEVTFSLDLLLFRPVL